MAIDFDPTFFDPDVFLALSLSVPSDAGSPPSRPEKLFSVETDSKNLHIVVPRSSQKTVPIATLLGSKETIATALLLRRLYETRFERNPEPLQDALIDFAHECYYRSRENERHPLRSQLSSNGPFWPNLFKRLDAGPTH